MLNFPNSMAVFSLLCIFMVFIDRCKAMGTVAGSIGIKYSNIKIIMHPGPAWSTEKEVLHWQVLDVLDDMMP